MSDDLVEKVAAAIRPHLYSEGGNSEVVARAAIAAVLEHYSNPDNVTNEMLDAHARADGGKTSADFRKGYAAAMSAALRAAAGSAPTTPEVK